MTTIAELSEWPISYLIDYIHNNSNIHQQMTHDQMVMLVAQIMMNNGDLDPTDADYMSIPGFDQIYVTENGNLSKTISHFAVDVGANSIGSILRLIN